MILGFKTRFADGLETGFEELIKEGVKIHSIREGHRWSAGCTIQMATGVRTKNYRQFNAGLRLLEKCVSVQGIWMTYQDGKLTVQVDGKRLSRGQLKTLIANDGLTYERFIKWFFPNGKLQFAGQIMHWTNCRYSGY